MNAHSLIGFVGAFALSGWSFGQVTIDGMVDASYGDALAVQDTRTGFGDADHGLMDFCNGSELDEAFAQIEDGTLYIMLAGNLESNFNHIEVFIDSIPGEGQSPILNNNPGVDFGALGNMGTWGAPGDKDYAQGFTFDDGFAADFWIGTGCGNDPFEFFISYSQLVTGGDPESAHGFGGSNSAGEMGAVVLKNGIIGAIDNSNTVGVLACDESGCADGDGTGVTTGYELAIPLDVIGYTEGDALKVVAFINNSDHFYVSNQFLPGVAGLGNLEYSRWVNLAEIEGDQFFSVVGGGGTGDCPGDFNGDGEVNGADFGALLAAWGPCSAPCTYDLSDDGQITGADVGLILSYWGSCP